MAQEKIEFRKIRDFGEVLTATFLFLRIHFGPLLKSFFAICAVFMLTQAIFNGIYQSQSLGFLDEIFQRKTAGPRQLSHIFTFEYVMVILFWFLTMLSMQVAISAYIKHYVEHDTVPGIEQVWAIFRRYFLKALAYSIPINLAVLIGTVLCLAPGVYLGVVFTPFVLVVVLEEKGFVAAYDRCFALVYDNFWISLGVYIVAYLIYSFGGSIIGLVVAAIAGVSAYLTTGNLSTTIGIVTSFLNIFSLCFYVIFFVSVAFHYFNLAEKLDATGILDRINNIGSGSAPGKDIEEQY